MAITAACVLGAGAFLSAPVLAEQAETSAGATSGSSTAAGAPAPQPAQEPANVPGIVIERDLNAQPQGCPLQNKSKLELIV